jgi:effector-binding domain-containing protein
MPPPPSAPDPAPAYDIEVKDLEPQPVAVVRGHVAPEDIESFLGGVFEEVATTAGQQGLEVVGPPFGRWTPRDGGFDATAGFPLTGRVEARGRVEPDELPGGTVARTLHSGPYDAVGAAYAATFEWLAGHGLEVTGEPWESYLDGPDVAQPRTRVCVPCSPRTTDGS